MGSDGEQNSCNTLTGASTTGELLRVRCQCALAHACSKVACREAREICLARSCRKPMADARRGERSAGLAKRLAPAFGHLSRRDCRAARRSCPELPGPRL